MQLFGFNLKEKYNPDVNFADYLTNEYKNFEKNFNDLLRERYPSFTDEIKRTFWLTKKIKIKDKTLTEVEDGLLYLITSNFENGKLITFDNSHLVSYLREIKTYKIYKIIKISRNSYYYSTLGSKAILSVKFSIKQAKLGKRIVIKYSNGYLAETAFTYSTFAEVQQRVDAKQAFYASYKAVGNRITKYFETDVKLDKISKKEKMIGQKVED